MPETKRKIALIGGGPSALFMYKRLVESRNDFEIDIFEKSNQLGAGMPYSAEGACVEHITNVSGNEVPRIVTNVQSWIKGAPKSVLKRFHIDPDKFTRYNILPRLLFGKYLEAQFKMLLKQGEKQKLATRIHLGVTVKDVVDRHEENLVYVRADNSEEWQTFDAVIICSGHRWPKTHEGKVKGYFDSPYPPGKLESKLNHPVAIRGASLTAIDAIRTLARYNGKFHEDENGKLVFTPDKDSAAFKLVLHSKNGLLPAVRFHLDEPRLSGASLMNEDEIRECMALNGGFLPLDTIFDEKFKKNFIKKDPVFYKKIRKMNMEQFVEYVMEMREGREPFELLRKEYAEAEKSIEERKSIFWKEMLAELSFTMNYPAKYLSAEDMLRMKKVLMPLIAMVIAFVPQSSCEELLALNDAGRLDIVSVGADSSVEPSKDGGVIYKYTDEQGKSHITRYKTFVDSIGQPHLSCDDLPFKGLIERRSVSQAYIRFKSKQAGEAEIKNENKDVKVNDNGDYFLKVPGIAIDDYFRIVNAFGIPNERLFIMAVPYIGGYNPDYSGLDFCEEASKGIMKKLV